MDKISLILKSKKISTAEKRLNRLKEQKDKLPDLIVEGINKIDKNFNKLTLHIENNDIPSTNNLSELFFRVTCPASLKKRYRTDKGVNRKMKINRSRWNYRICLGKKDSILPIFVLQPTNELLNI